MVDISWGNDSLQVNLVETPSEALHFRSVGLPGASPLTAGRPAVEVLTAEFGRIWASQRLVGTTLGWRLRYESHAEHTEGTWRQLRVRLRDPETQMSATLHLECHDGIAALRAHVELEAGTTPLTVLSMPSIALRVPDRGSAQLTSGEGEWLAESRWTTEPLSRTTLVDVGVDLHKQNARGALVRRSSGSWSTGSALPTGLLDFGAGAAWMWQIEHNGPWRWEIGNDLLGSYLSLSGPTDLDHQFSRVLDDSTPMRSVDASLSFGADAETATAAMTDFRRVSRRAHPDNFSRAVVFNDYMNTVMADPTTEKLLPLIDAAAHVGAEVFCIDAGWYADDGNWWDTVGEWRPSTQRFTRGLEELVDRIRSHGMLPGLWLEPEVIGVRSPALLTLPPDALLSRNGVPLAEQGRHHLDLRHAAARAHLDEVVDRLVSALGIGYLKLDYNIDPGPGTDRDAPSVGAGLLDHNRAHLAWIDGVLDRHPTLILENCASGAMRADFAMMSRMQVQSTSDQQSALAYAPISASAAMGMLPEQAASWAYPQPEMSEEEIILTLANTMLGRFYFSGHLDQASPAQRALVAGAVEAHKGIRPELIAAHPIWPMGLPAWDAAELATGLALDESILLTMWRRERGASELVMPLARWSGREVEVEEIFPRRRGGWSYTWNPEQGSLTAHIDVDEPSARTIRLRVAGSTR